MLLLARGRPITSVNYQRYWGTPRTLLAAREWLRHPWYMANGNTGSERVATSTVAGRARQNAGFSLIELLLVVAVILVISAMAVPNLVRARIAANEASAVGSLRAIDAAETTYAVTYPSIGFTCTLRDLQPPAGFGNPDPQHAGLIDAALASGVKAAIDKTGPAAR